jgi:hypothetical protein
MLFELNLIHPYKYKDIDAERFLDEKELENYQSIMAEILDTNKDLAQADLRLIQKFNKARHEYFQFMESSTQIKISSFLLRLAMKLRYAEKMPRTEGGPGRTPGKWWGKMLDELDEGPSAIKVSPNQAAWLIEVWNHESVQNSWEASIQSWVNLLDEEIVRLDKVCNGKEDVLDFPKKD